MSGFKIELKGMDEVMDKLKIDEQAISDELADFGFAVARDAANNLSLHGTTDFGFLANSIDAVPGHLSVTVVAHKDYAAYVEFGTGPYAATYLPSIEPEWRAIARQFFVNGKGRMPAQPYLHPAFAKNLIELEKKLTSILGK
jgi:hypothetical protein